MNYEDNFIRFDWATKRILRDKANFGVLEGLITVLLNEHVHIVEILEENIVPDIHYDKIPSLTIEAIDSCGEPIVINLQQTRQLYYLECLTFGFPKSDIVYDKYDKVTKVYSISILYFDLGKGADYLYHGQATFTGVHTHDTLQITTKEKDVIEMKTPQEVFPEYFLIRVNEFNKVATTPIEEWMEYLKSGYIRKDTSAPGLQEAREKLNYLQMSAQERSAYDHHIDAIMIQNDVISTAQKEGRAEGRAENKIETAQKMKAKKYPVEDIAEITGLSTEEINALEA